MDLIFIREIKVKRDCGFNAVESAQEIIDFLDGLVQIMVDPENDPPQFSKEEAWQKYLDYKAKLQHMHSDAE